jgi:hypothetical protein
MRILFALAMLKGAASTKSKRKPTSQKCEDGKPRFLERKPGCLGRRGEIL